MKYLLSGNLILIESPDGSLTWEEAVVEGTSKNPIPRVNFGRVSIKKYGKVTVILLKPEGAWPSSFENIRHWEVEAPTLPRRSEAYFVRLNQKGLIENKQSVYLCSSGEVAPDKEALRVRELHEQN